MGNDVESAIDNLRYSLSEAHPAYEDVEVLKREINRLNQLVQMYRELVSQESP